MEINSFLLGCLVLIETGNLILRLIKISMDIIPPIDPYIQKRMYS